MARNDRKQRKKKERQERIRKEKYLRHSVPDFEEGFELPPEPAVERMLRGKPSLLGRMLSWLPGVRRRSSAQDQAQELAYDAMEEHDPERAVALARQALNLDPECSDALYTLALNAAKSRQEQIQLLEQATAAAERRLGGELFFRNNRGHFWGIIETRPYMRARAALADILRGEGQMAEAIGHYEALLDLNPNDNQSLRDVLLGCYFLADDREGVHRLLSYYELDDSAVFAYGRVLERFLAGDQEEAARLRHNAHEANPYVEGYLTGRRKLPRYPPEWCSPGDDNEAVHCAFYLADAWKRHPEAIAWLDGRRG